MDIWEILFRIGLGLFIVIGIGGVIAQAKLESTLQRKIRENIDAMGEAHKMLR